ncbi:hypothetical protein A4A49_42462 [Nicotiana attenuata]|uniref:Uncharacterized protein n=2 Tax=Nicotiana attenuata TaxID=49451 RepID=A0A1J6KD15_NICAT|nr:hypothetical protein A4A49_42462 [Nicotiana attenuata]
MDLDNIKSNLLALRQLYGLLRNDGDGLSKLTSDGLDYEARVMLKNLLDTTTNDVLKAHSEIIARQARVHSLPQPQHLVDTANQRSLALSDLSKSSAVIQSCGRELVVMDSTLSTEKQESIMPITQTAYTQPPQFSFSASESGNKRKFCRICKRPKFEKPFIPCIQTESSEKEAPCSTKVVALQEQQNSLFANFSWDIQQEALQSGNTGSANANEVLDLHHISNGAQTVDLSQSMHELSGVVRRVPDGDHDFSTETNDVIKQLESHISALQMDAENLVLADKHAAEHKIKPITVFVPQAELATPIKKIQGDTSSLYSGYVVPPTGMQKISADQLPKPLESSSYQPNQSRQQKIVANTFSSEEYDTSKMLDLVEENQWQIQKEHSINVQSKNQNDCTSVQNPYADRYCSQQDQQNMEIGLTALPAMLVIPNQNQMPSNEKTGRLGPNAADIFRNNVHTQGLIDYGSKLTWSGAYESRMDSPYSQQAIMRRSVLNHKQGQFAPSQSSYVDLDKKPSKHLKNNNHMKRLRRRHLHGHESEVSRSSSPYSSSGTDLQQTSTYSSERDHPLPRQVRTKMHLSDETSSYGGNELYSRRDSSQTEYTVSSSCSSTEGYSSPIGSERAREMISASKSEREISSSLDGSGSNHLEEPSYYSADSSSRKSSPARVYKSANSRKSKKNNGRWKKLKDKLAIVFHHHHHHHHHHSKDGKGKERKTSLLRQRGKRFNGHYSTSKDETFGEKALEKFGKSAIDKQAGKKQQGGQFQTLAQGLIRHIQHSKKPKHSSSRQVDKGPHTNTKVNSKFHWWQLLQHHRGMNKSPAMLGAGNKKGHSKAFSKKK